MNFYKQASLVLTSILLSACGTIYSEDGLIKDNSYEYLNAKQIPDLVIPESLSQKGKADFTTVPAIGAKAQEAALGREVNIGAPIQILAVLDNVRVNKQATNPAIFISEKPDFLWETFIKLFTEYEIKLARNDTVNYVLETDWVAVDKRGVWLGIAGEDDIDEFRAKYRVSMTEGPLLGEKEVEVVRFVAQELNEDTDKWEDAVTFWQDSAEMLNLLISHYDKVVLERDLIVRQSMLAGFDVELAQDDDNNAALVTSADIELVWNKLPSVLEVLDFKVNDRDRRLQTYFVKYEFEEPGFFASLFNSEKKPLPLESGDYQVTLRYFGEQTAIIFRDGQGAPLDSATLVKMYPELSKQFGTQR